MYLLGFPLLLIPFAIYNIVAFVFYLPPEFWTTQAAAVPMVSGQIWKLTWEDIFLAVSIFLLWLEVVKSTRISNRTIMDHVLALLLFVAVLVEFLLVKSVATSTFFLLLVISLADALAGFAIGNRGATRRAEAEVADKTSAHDVRLPFPSP